ALRVARSEPLRPRVLASLARVAASARTGCAARSLRHLHPLPRHLPPRRAAPRHLRLHAPQARPGRRSARGRLRSRRASAGRGGRARCRSRIHGMTAHLPAATARGRALERDLAAIVGKGAVSCEPSDLWAMSRDCWPRALLWTRAGKTPHPPDVVAWPSSTDEVARIVRFAAGNGAAVVPFGAGSGVCGAAVPTAGGIALDLKRMGALSEVDLPRRFAQVEAGMIGQRLDELLNAEKATLGHFPSSIYCSTAGGWLAARSAGQLSSRYGKIEDMVLSIEAVDGTGAILRTLDGPSAGPDLTQLLVGSEGTLAVITGARLRIWRRPRERWLRGVRFPSVQHGMRALRGVMRSGLRPAVARLYDPLDTLLAGRSGGGPVLQVPQPLKWVVE